MEQAKQWNKGRVASKVLEWLFVTWLSAGLVASFVALIGVTPYIVDLTITKENSWLPVAWMLWLLGYVVVIFVVMLTGGIWFPKLKRFLFEKDSGPESDEVNSDFGD